MRLTTSPRFGSSTTNFNTRDSIRGLTRRISCQAKTGEYEIGKAVRAADVVLVCLSRKSINKNGYVQKEIRIALDAADQMPAGRIFLIPVKLENCSVPERFSGLHWVDLTVPGAHVLADLGLYGPSPIERLEAGPNATIREQPVDP